MRALTSSSFHCPSARRNWKLGGPQGAQGRAQPVDDRVQGGVPDDMGLFRGPGPGQGPPHGDGRPGPATAVAENAHRVFGVVRADDGLDNMGLVGLGLAEGREVLGTRQADQALGGRAAALLEQAGQAVAGDKGGTVAGQGRGNAHVLADLPQGLVLEPLVPGKLDEFAAV